MLFLIPGYNSIPNFSFYTMNDWLLNLHFFQIRFCWIDAHIHWDCNTQNVYVAYTPNQKHSLLNFLFLVNSLIYSLIYIMGDMVLGLAPKMIDSYFSSQNKIKILIRNAILVPIYGNKNFNYMVNSSL